MSETTKYTPGPWAFTTYPIYTPNHDDAGVVWKDNKDGSALICHCSKSPGIEQGKANAQLIAAAPELLEMLLELKTIAYRDLNLDTRFIDKIENAIKKATTDGN